MFIKCPHWFNLYMNHNDIIEFSFNFHITFELYNNHAEIQVCFTIKNYSCWYHGFNQWFQSRNIDSKQYWLISHAKMIGFIIFKVFMFDVAGQNIQYSIISVNFVTFNGDLCLTNHHFTNQICLYMNLTSVHVSLGIIIDAIILNVVISYQASTLQIIFFWIWMHIIVYIMIPI